MKVQFDDSHCEARTDGYLRDKISNKIRALIEVKAAVRGKNIRPIVEQESAAMSNWINQDPKTTGLAGRYGAFSLLFLAILIITLKLRLNISR